VIYLKNAINKEVKEEILTKVKAGEKVSLLKKVRNWITG